MGIELVSGSDFPIEGSEQTQSSAAPVSYTEIFYQHLPYYLSIGMTYEQFWHGDNELKRYYRQAHDLKRKRDNFDLWLQGKYIYDALCCVAPLLRFSMSKGKVEAYPYTKEPYPTTEKEVRERRERDEKARMEKMKAQFESMVVGFNTSFQKKHNEEVTENA